MCQTGCGEKEATYIREMGKSCPTKMMEAIVAFNAEGRPIWKPQPIYRLNSFVTRNGSGRARSNAHIREVGIMDVGTDVFNRGQCLPSNNKMTEEEPDVIIEIIHNRFFL